jgi:uncharacterized protein
MQVMKNTQLFSFGAPVTGNDLVGRGQDIQRILQDLRGGQSLFLPGPRRIGKSSVVLECLGRLKKEKFDTSYVDLMGVNSIRELANEIAAAVIATDNRKLRRLMRRISTKIGDLLKIKEFKIAYREFEAVAILRDQQTPELEALKASFDLLKHMQKKRRHKLICAFDEFGEVNSLDRQLTKIMRSKFQLHKNVTYLFSGSQESILSQMFSNPKEPFYGFAKEVHLSPIKRQAFAHYIQQKLKKEKITISDDMAYELCSWTAAHPFYTKVFANHLYEYVVMHNISTIDQKSTLDQAYRKAFESLKNDLERLWMELGTGVTRQVCIFLALENNQKIFAKDGLKGEIETTRIAQSLRTLESKGIIRKIQPGQYNFVNHFLKEYIFSLYDPNYEKRYLKPKTSPVPSTIA